jgi:hypothetical protein
MLASASSRLGMSSSAPPRGTAGGTVSDSVGDRRNLVGVRRPPWRATRTAGPGSSARGHGYWRGGRLANVVGVPLGLLAGQCEGVPGCRKASTDSRASDAGIIQPRRLTHGRSAQPAGPQGGWAPALISARTRYPRTGRACPGNSEPRPSRSSHGLAVLIGHSAVRQNSAPLLPRTHP